MASQASHEEEFRSEIENLKENVRDLDDDLSTVKKRLDDLEHKHARYCQSVKETVIVAHKTPTLQAAPPLPSQPPPLPPRSDAKQRDVIEITNLRLDSHGTHEWSPPAIVMQTSQPAGHIIADGVATGHAAKPDGHHVPEKAVHHAPQSQQPNRPNDFAHLDMNEILAAANLNDVSKTRFTTPPKDNRVEFSEETTLENGHTVTKRLYVTSTSSQVVSTNKTLNGTRNGEHAIPHVQVIGLKKHKGDNHLVSTAYCARVSHVSSDPVIAFLQGLTVRQENGQLIIDRITDESPVAKQGLLHVGDSILEVNGVEVKTPEDLHNQLNNTESVSLKVVPSGLESGPVINGVSSDDQDYVRCCFDYDPTHDEQIPSKNIGLAFKVGDILQIISKDDPDWWQARKVNDWSYVGLIPSQNFEERRKAAAADTAAGIPTLRNVVGGQLIENAQKKAKKIMYNVKNNADFDEYDILCYEEVGKLSPYGRRVLVLLGAPGVGRRTLKARLLQHDPDNFATITPYTSRKPRDTEMEGREYHFSNREKLQKEIDQGEFLEWGEFNNNFYGTKTESVKKIIRGGRVCVLDCSPQAIKFLYNSEFMPYIVYIAPPPYEEFKQLYQIHPSRTKPKSEDDMKRICDDSAVMEANYRHLFDLVLVNRNAEVTFRRLSDALESLKSQTQWVPVSWLYS